MSKTGEFQNEGINRYRDSVCFHESAFPGWHECVGLVMRAQTENERIATRRIAKAIIEQGSQEAWSKLTEDMAAGKIAMAVARH